MKALAAGVVQCRSGETAAEATPLPRLVHLGVREGDPAVSTSRTADEKGHHSAW